MWKLNPVLSTPLPSGIEALQGEPVGVDALVAGIASWVLLMLFYLFPQGGGVLAMLRLDHLDILGWRRESVARNILGNPGPSQDG